MADEPVQDPQATPGRGDGQDSRSLWGLLAIVAVIAIVVLAFLMLRGCGSGSAGGNANTTAKEIVPVTGLRAVPGSVSVWVAQGTEVSAVLSVAGASGYQVTNMGGGRYVVTVPAGTEDSVIAKLKREDGVYDAGRVFANGSSASVGTTGAAGAASGTAGY